MPGLWRRIHKMIGKDKENDIFENNTDWLDQSLSPEVRVVVRRPRSFAESESIAAMVKNGQAVVVNLEGVPAQTAQRLVDYLSGATYAIDGNMEKIGMGMFLFAPPEVNIHVRDLFGVGD
ncbi:MAG: cell division protein SepF [bacterium]